MDTRKTAEGRMIVPKRKAKFCFSIDRGGTFTDVYASIPGKPGYAVVKLLSEDPANYEDAPREGIRRILARYAPEAIQEDGLIDPSCIEWIRMGTTVATNALLERKGARCALLVSKGFADLLRIGDQTRPDLFDLRIRRPELLYEQVIEVNERIRPLRREEVGKGSVLEGTSGERFLVLAAPDLNALRPRLQSLLDTGISSLAIVFLHAYGCPQHEEQVAELALELGFDQVSLSSRVMPMVKVVPRGDTTLVDSYLTPHIRSYIETFCKGFKGGLGNPRLLFMQSDGGLTSADEFRGSRSILSGPAGGVVGYAVTTSRHYGNVPVIGFDMGGTSTDVSRYGGRYELCFENRTAGVRIQAPQLDIRTVAAGGGSRLFFVNGMFQVGPESAGAHPGPICYRKNGFLALTDANLVLGRLQPCYFPAIFGPEENLPLDLSGARQAMEEMTRRVNAHAAEQGTAPLSVEEVALGFIRVANEQMVRPIKEVSIMRGVDVKDHVLATFGGAGGQHACAIARSLGMRRVFIHRFAGILSAYGMGLARTVAERQQPAACTCPSELPGEILERLDLLRAETEAELREQGIPGRKISTTCSLNLRYQGTDTSLMIDLPEDGDCVSLFKETYRREFGFELPGRDILIDDLRVCSVAEEIEVADAAGEIPAEPAAPLDRVACYFEQGWLESEVYRFEELGAGQEVEGPALLLQDTSTIVIEPGCRGRMSSRGDLEILLDQESRKQLGRKVNPVQLAVFSNLFMSIAEQMGRMLQKTAVSTNIKERLDFSCALFDHKGNLVANAPHVPVHLGSMSEAVREQIRRNPDIRRGTVFLSNHPAAGGSHLPDITVITPVFQQGRIIFFVAGRGHHADIGGTTPGSMPPDSRTLAEEGVAVESFKLVEEGRFQEEKARRLFDSSRCVQDVLSDLKAQVAANSKGIELVEEMVERYGLEVVQAYMGHVQRAAEQAVRGSLIRLADSWPGGEKTVRVCEYLDDGSPVVLRLTIDRRSGDALFDFTGTGCELWGNLNAPRAVTDSAVLYCLRCLLEKEIPLNYGCLIPITIKLPEGSLLNPSARAAVVGGNVLTSQRLVDLILKGFRVAAASQGCMNNLTFGNDTYGYYETIGGGAGAGPDWHGQSGVHTHMTNTRITDPEILERRYPVLLREFSLRKNSGGAGRFKGGDGLVRDIEFLEPMNVAILSERRVFAPYGLAGGQPGKRGKNFYIDRDGRKRNLGGKNRFQAAAGERIRIETPGGGGYGQP